MVSDFGAVCLALAGFTFWVLCDSTIKLIGGAALPPYEVIAYLGLFVMVCIGAYATLRGQPEVLRPREPKKQLVRSCLDLSNNICVVIALRHVPLTLFYILVFTAPMVITVLAAFFLKEKIKVHKALAILAGFAGVVIAVNPFDSAHPRDWIGYAACGVCVACFSVSMVWSRVLTRTETPESLAFFSGMVMVAVGFGSMMVWHAASINVHLFLYLFAMGLFCSLGSICFFVAVKHTSAANVSQYHYTQLLTGAVVSYLVWRELPTPSMIAGGVLIIAAGLYIAILTSREGRLSEGGPHGVQP